MVVKSYFMSAQGWKSKYHYCLIFVEEPSTTGTEHLSFATWACIWSFSSFYVSGIT